MQAHIQRVTDGEDLSQAEARAAASALFEDATPAQIGALLGIGLFALPASILASGFMEEREAELEGREEIEEREAETEDADEEWEYCPHCGEKLE